MQFTPPPSEPNPSGDDSSELNAPPESPSRVGSHGPRADASRLEPPRAAKRPRYVFAALLTALALGLGCWTDGYERLRTYQTPLFSSGKAEPAMVLDTAIRDEQDRARTAQLYEQYISVADRDSKTAFPLAAATWVLGGALIFFALRALGRRTQARDILVQILVVQTAIVALSHFMTTDIRNAQLDLEMHLQLIMRRQTLTAEQLEQAAPMFDRLSDHIRRFGVPGWLVFRSAAGLLAAFALTRPRARAYFEPAPTAPTES